MQPKDNRAVMKSEKNLNRFGSLMLTKQAPPPPIIPYNIIELKIFLL
jgi:hypothetical protein